MPKIKKLLFPLMISILFATSAAAHNYGVKFQNGDFLLVSADNDSLSSAINRVTQTKKSTNYSHIALLEKEKNGKLWVMDAGTRNGSERIPLDTFLGYEQKNGRHIDVYRLKKQYQHAVPNAIKVGKTLLGKPYNYSYILSDKKLYCSDFVQRCFAKDSIFKLYPMTFINPKTGKIDATWKAYYKKLGLKVPEGKMGCNPNQMAASPKVEYIGRIK